MNYKKMCFMCKVLRGSPHLCVECQDALIRNWCKAGGYTTNELNAKLRLDY